MAILEGTYHGTMVWCGVFLENTGTKMQVCHSDLLQGHFPKWRPQRDQGIQLGKRNLA